MKSAELLFLIFFILSCGCRQSEGPCEYDIIEIQAKIISIEPYSAEEYKKHKLDENKTQLFHVVLRFNESNMAKNNQLLEDIVPRIKHKTDSAFIARNKIIPGEIYTGTVSEIKSGNCQPLYVSLNHYLKTE